MNRRNFLQLTAAAPLLSHPGNLPEYRVVTRFHAAGKMGFPGPYPGRAVRVRSERAIDAASNRVDASAVKTMLSRGIRELTGATNDHDAWSHFISPSDTVGIKVNCSGAPEINSNPELVSAIIDNLIALGVPADHIYIYDRFENQLKIVNFGPKVAAGVKISGAESARGSILGYDPRTYVEVNFFGEEDTRSNLIRLVSDTLTKVINVPTMKEHRAAGVTGCLKNIAYGDFSNVARSHQKEKTNTYSFIGTLASVEPLRSRTVLNIMDGLRSLWQGGPFLQSPKFLFFPKQLVLGTDPVTLDHVLLNMIEEKRKQEGAPSLFERGPDHLKRGPELDPQYNSFIREPGHIEYASTLGLGVFDKARIKETAIEL